MRIAHWMAVVLCIGLALPAPKRVLKGRPELDILSSRFALIGKLDTTRDGKDDRAGLKRAIKAAGGTVDYDLPEPEDGQEVGRLAPQIDWYVVDDRTFCPSPDAPVDVGRLQFKKLVSERIRDARLDGIRPMPLSRLIQALHTTTR